MSVSQKGLVVVHAAFVGTLAWLAGRALLNLVEQARSGYTPPAFEEELGVLVVAPVTVGVLVILGLAIWLRGGGRLQLGIADLAATGACFSILIVFVFMDDSLFLTWALGPACVILTGSVQPPGLSAGGKWVRVTLVAAGTLFLLVALSVVIPSAFRSLY